MLSPEVDCEKETALNGVSITEMCTGGFVYKYCQVRDAVPERPISGMLAVLFFASYLFFFVFATVVVYLLLYYICDYVVFHLRYRT